MAHLTTIRLTNLPPTLAIHAALFTHVANAAVLRAQLLAANPAFSYALLDASALLSTTHALAAAFRAATDARAARLRTRNVHAETVFALAPNNNIAEAFRRFGIGDASEAVLVLKIVDEEAEAGVTADSVRRHLAEVVEGTSVPFDDETLGALTDVEAVKRIYKIGGPGKKGARPAPNGVVNGTALSAAELRELEVNVLATMALKGS